MSASLTNKKRRNLGDLIFYILMIAIPVANIIVFYFGVNFNSIILSFQEWNSTTESYDIIGFENFKWVWLMLKDASFLQSLKNSLIAYVFGYGISETLCILISFFMYKKFFGGRVFRVILFLPSIVSAIAMTIMFKYFVERFIPETAKILFDVQISGLLSNQNTVFPTLIFYGIWTGLGSGILIYTGTMNSINESLSEYARLDGMNDLQELIYIVIPSIWPTFVTFFVANFSGVLSNQLNLYNFYNQGASSRLWTTGYYMYRETLVAGKSQYPTLSAMGLTFTIVMAPATLFVRWLMLKFGPKED